MSDPRQEARRLPHYIEWNSLTRPRPAEAPHTDECPGCIGEALARRVENAERELTELVEAALSEHHIATAGPRKGRMIHSDCPICDWLDSHPVRQALRQEDS